jgi:regulator of cell morphogenesis and NO signaling
MSYVSPSATVGQLVAEKPGRARVFEKYGIDYCCGGKIPLEAACRAKDISVDEVVRQLTDYDESLGNAPEQNWTQASIGEIVDYITTAYHKPLVKDLERINTLLKKVVAVHSERQPKLKALQEVFERFRGALELHMQKEDMVLFPLCKELETAKAPVVSHCGSVSNPIHVMLFEHDQAGSELSAMRELTDNYQAPDGACGSFRALLDALSEMELTMHQHVALENNVLFPKAQEAELRLTQHCQSA